MAEKKLVKFKRTENTIGQVEADFKIEDGKIYFQTEEDTEFRLLTDLDEIKYFNGKYGVLSFKEKAESEEIPEE
ncbi:hypothetical protein IRP63_14905 (plasmid) [Clostridium botulinum]|uniref:Uncharacterized protein n=1 Tax=Clostridium botulinum C/D str. DC5 TaxID=1443128 RepID=A0A0A0I168_CLOBO|nr:hypothetical protein [Clostridium botulinum]KGM93375.1 hypothetical protein Z955_15520 [Clostridium botulinum C/D str. DC5]KOA94883.1 hypothetical protein ADU76_02470 [Clostridium botulinum]KOC56941.1 hypothetical protein ADU89_01750 [Clostridium botulinum]KOC57416.1 hypothetical protein ADU90_06290 [Clostridium botulinum]MCD3232656.1 hypothetical protein [Clostridium botulinum D/C]